MKKVLLIFFMFILFSTVVFANVGFQLSGGIGMAGGSISDVLQTNYYSGELDLSDQGILSVFFPLQLGINYALGATVIDFNLGFGMPAFQTTIGALQEFHLGNAVLGFGLGYAYTTDFEREGVGLGTMYVRLTTGYIGMLDDYAIKVPLYVDFYIPTENTGFGFNIGISLMFEGIQYYADGLQKAGESLLDSYNNYN